MTGTRKFVTDLKSFRANKYGRFRKRDRFKIKIRPIINYRKYLFVYFVFVDAVVTNVVDFQT